MKDFKALSARQFDKQPQSVWGRDGYNSHLYRSILDELILRQPQRVLDLGCGGGALLERAARALPTAELTGLDLSANMVSMAKARLGDRAHVIQGDAEAMPFDDGTFDAIVCNESFHHYPNPRAALSEASRVLRPGGVLLLCDLAMSERMRRLANWLFKRINTGDVHVYSEAEIRALLTAAGFQVVRYANLSPSAFLCVARIPV